MNLLISRPASRNGADASASLDGQMQSAIAKVMDGLRNVEGSTDRRSAERVPYPQLVALTPLSADGRPLPDRAFLVAGKHLSARGLGFYHPQPLPYRRVLATLETADGQPMSFLLDLSWCRSIRYGWYESGGRFLRPSPTPESAK